MKRGLKALVLALAMAAAVPAMAQTFPSKEIRFINGFPAGGTSDIIGRVLAEQLTRQARQDGRGRQQGRCIRHDRGAGDGESRRPTATRSCSPRWR